MRYLLLLLLAGCVATEWSKQGATAADEDRDFEECRQIARPDPAIAAIFGAFGAVGVFFGVNHTDSKIRACMEGKGWLKPAQDTPPAKTGNIVGRVGFEPTTKGL